MTKKNIPKVDWKVVCVGLVCISAIECFALANGINGTLLSIVLGIIALAIGIVIPNPIK